MPTESTKKQVYFSGSIRGGREDAVIYNKIIDILKLKYDVLTEHIGLADLNKFEDGKTDKYIYLRDRTLLDQCDLVIAECSTPSLGVGYELAYAEAHRKPVVVLYDITRNKKLSAMIAGDDTFKKIYYSSEKDLLEIVAQL
ncbi:MAG: nucleoside 2-deoxyribosyltransferase [Bacilli bacterium]|jgi:nucleoside 2-deoxyribosyltransferase|nr:nucleoside 2-deoxyribosyltransferase [Bacilli bacterium]